jgi:class 3 adenylate cyclase/tetratricopeptide (TPR) repeat protein
MRCPKCQFENPDDAQFCIECGNPIEFHCPQCLAITPATGKFCKACGQNLTIPSKTPPKKLSINEKLEKIQRYLPKGLTEKILSQRDRIEGERKQITVMFCDMEGFTPMSELLGIEEAYSVMDQVYEILIRKVHDYEGTVNEMTGDGILALFGAPIALEDAPQRAIRASLAIHREMAKFSNQIKRQKNLMATFKMRIGIHSGPVVVGTLGNDLRVEFKAVGDTVNLASRIEELAEPGSTYISEETFKKAEGFFRFEALGEFDVKGIQKAVKTYRAIAPSTKRTRFDVSTERGLTPFVGRERELELLLDCLDRAGKFRGQAISIVAEAGLGKSRLLYEFRKAVANLDVTFLEGRCLSYSRGVAYHLHTDILKANFDIRESDGDSEIIEKVKRGLKILGTDEVSTLPYLLELLQVKKSGIGKMPISSEEKKYRINEVLKRIVLDGAEIRPLILAYEDLHWADKVSEDVLNYVLESIPGARVLLIFTFRPEFVQTWGSRSFHSQINLNRLSNREGLIMVSHLLGTEELDMALENLILQKTEGVPFFIEEFIRSLKDLKLLEKKDGKYYLEKNIEHMTIPSTIQDVIMARVDALPEGAKEVLQAGAVIEREFSYKLIKRVTDFAEQELLSHVSAIKDSELLYERGIFPKTTYIFKHALTREVVYDSILSKNKKKLHAMIGNAIEELYKENIVEYYGVLAKHFITSQTYEKAAEYSRLAAKHSEKVGSINDAIIFSKKRVASLEKMARTNQVEKKIIDARTALGLYLSQMRQILASKEAIDPIIDLALKTGSRKRLPQILTIIGTYNYFVEEDFPTAFKNLEEAIKVSDEVKDTISLAVASYFIGLALLLCCEYEKGIHYYEKALKSNVKANRLWGIATIKSSLSVFAYYFYGKVNLAIQTSEEAFHMAEESGDIYSKLWASVCHGINYFGKGFFEEAEKHLLKGIHFCEMINFPTFNAVARSVLAELYCEIEEYESAKNHYGKSIWLWDSNSLLPSWSNLAKLGLAKTKVLNNEKDIDIKLTYSYLFENKQKLLEGWMLRYMAEILLNVDDQHIAEAEILIKQAVDVNKKRGVMFHLGMDYIFYAKLFKRKGNISNAEENLKKAIEIFKECGGDGWVEKAEKYQVLL